MNLRRKLLLTFGGLALMTLLVAGVSLLSMILWQKTNTMLEEHYQRCLLLQRVQASVFRAVKEVPDALSSSDEDTEEEFEELIVPMAEDFEHWAELAHTDVELAQVETIFAAYQQVITDVHQIFNMVKQNRRGDAVLLMEERLEDKTLRTFQTLTEKAEASDREYRQHVQERVRWVRRTSKIILAISAFGAISLILMLFAYLFGDLFAPLRALVEALRGMAQGDYQRRLSEDRNDELGDVYRTFNRMAEAVTQRQRLSSLAVGEGANEDITYPWQDAPSRLTLHRLLSRLKAQVHQLRQQGSEGTDDAAAETVQDVTASLDHLLEIVVRFAEFGFPLDLNLAHFDVRMLLYEVLLRFHEPFAQRGVGFDIDVARDVETVFADRLKLREVLGELIRNALVALLARGGHIGVHAFLVDGGNALQIEVADNGQGAEPELINRAFALDDTDETRPPLGLVFARSIVEQHGGQIDVHSQLGEGTCVRLTLPTPYVDSAGPVAHGTVEE